MKTNYYILIALLVTFSFASAQSNVVENTVEPTVMISETYQESSVENVEAIENENIEVEEDLASTNSDIKIYLNRLRNEGNINLLFPKINKVITA